MDIKKSSESITNLTLKGMAWFFICNITQTALNFLMVIVMSRILSTIDFGFMSAALTIINLSDIFFQLGIGPAIIQRSNISKEHVITGFTVSLILGFLFTTTIFFSAPVVETFYNMKGLSSIIKAVSIIFIITSFSIIPECLLQKELKFKKTAIVNLVSFFLGNVVIGIILALYGFGVWSLVISYLAQALIKTTAFLFIFKYKWRLGLNAKALKDLMSFGIGFSIARIFNYIALQGDYIIVGKFLGSKDLGLYSRAYQLMVTPTTIFGQVLDKVLFSAMAKVQHQRNTLYEAFRKGVTLISIIILPISMFAFTEAHQIINVVLGQKWLDMVVPFQVLAVGMLFRTSYKMGESVARATGAVYKRAWRQAFYALLVISGAIAGLNWGITGVALGVLFAIVINYILMAHLSLKILKMKWSTYFLVQIPGAVLALVTYVTSQLAHNLIKLFTDSKLIILAGTLFTFTLLMSGAFSVIIKYKIIEDICWIFNNIRYMLFNKKNILGASYEK